MAQATDEQIKAMKLAKQHIGKAKQLLGEIEHPQAKVMLNQLDKKASKPNYALVVIVLVVSLLVGGIGGYVLGRESVIAPLRNAFSNPALPTPDMATLNANATNMFNTMETSSALFASTPIEMIIGTP